MTPSIHAITPDFVAEVGDVDLSGPLAPDTLEAIKQAFWKYAVLVFPDQKLSPSQQVAFAEHFGPLEKDMVLTEKGAAARVAPGFADISNLTLDGKIWEKDSRARQYKEGNKLWHTDSSFKRIPGLASLLYATTVVPFGGHTEFADERAAYDALPDDMKHRLAGLVAEHAIEASRRRTGFSAFLGAEASRLPAVPQMLVRTIPQNGRKSLYAAAHIGRIQGMEEAEGEALLQQLMTHITQRQFVYTHRWRSNDLVMWDNRCTMHRGTDFDDLRFVRDMRRATVSDVANTCEQEGLAVND